jgi:hypothetical protein
MDHWVTRTPQGLQTPSYQPELHGQLRPGQLASLGLHGASKPSSSRSIKYRWHSTGPIRAFEKAFLQEHGFEKIVKRLPGLEPVNATKFNGAAPPETPRPHVADSVRTFDSVKDISGRETSS